ncbi:MAG TPA: DoxX family membrane protein [Ignavibacteriaceae bacterium]|nr:DoxX family membrane protein [Ignavibacteriaceae bacterium]
MKILASQPIRFIYALLFTILGLNHIINPDDYLPYVPTFLPTSIFWVYLIGTFLIIASISIILKKYTKITCLILSIFLILVVFSVHFPCLFYPKFMQISIINILKDTGLAGGGLILAGAIDVSEVE